jgi:hypothetical protein
MLDDEIKNNFFFIKIPKKTKVNTCHPLKSMTLIMRSELSQ